MYKNDTLSIEQRIAACKKTGAEWLVYDPAKVSAEPSAKEYKAQRMEAMRRMYKNWHSGLIVDAGAAVCVKEDGTVGFLYEDDGSEERDHPTVQFLLRQKNVRKIFGGMRTAVVLYRDGTVAVGVHYKETEERNIIRFAKNLAKCLEPVNQWTGVVDIVADYNMILALHEDGRLSCCMEKNDRDVLSWAKRMTGVKDIGMISVAFCCRFEDGRMDSPSMSLDLEPYKWMKNIGSEHYAVASSYDFLAGLKHDGNFTVWYEKGNPDFAAIDGIRSWGKQAVIHAGFNTLLALAPDGEVRAMGKEADKYKGWTDVALITSARNGVEFAIRWDGSCVGTEGKESTLDFSWVFDAK